MRGNVSGLSPWIRHRLVTEPEVVAAVLARHAPSACAKFVQEVCWRTYWKGWLEQHPDAWTRYWAGLDAQAARVLLVPLSLTPSAPRRPPLPRTRAGAAWARREWAHARPDHRAENAR